LLNSLGWRAQTSLSDGLKRTLDYFLAETTSGSRRSV
jgi:nucleoside-diphosphate-sugar epimerase